MAKTTSENKELVKRIEDAVNQRDVDALGEVLADDFVFHGSAEELSGVDEFRDYLRDLYDGFPDLTVTFEEVVAEEGVVGVRYTGTGTHDGEYRGIQPTGETVDIAGMRMVRIDDGEISEVWAQDDDLGLLVQLGVVEPPAR